MYIAHIQEECSRPRLLDYHCAMWYGLSNAATLAQLAGVDTMGLISKIRQAARTARQNKKDCEHLARRVDTLAELLPYLQDPEARRPLAGLGDTLSEAHDLVMSCQGRGRTYQFFTACRQAERFRDVEKKIDSYLLLVPIISHIGIVRRLDGGTMDNNGSSHYRTQLESSGADEAFALAEITVATNNFAVVLSDGDAGTVYKGVLHNGREVAVKRLNPGRRGAEDAFGTELAILSPLRHDHIVRLVGFCAEDGERIVVTQYMGNGSLHDHLHGRSPSTSSPVTASWKTRVQVLLGAARGIKHLHCHAVPLIIHGNVTSSNILLEAATWAPRLSEFSASLWRAAGVESQPVEAVAGSGASAYGYADPEYCSTGRIKPASDVYNLGVVMLEVLTGKPPVVAVWEERSRSTVPMTLVSFALPSIQAGRLVDVFDRRPVAKPTIRQLEPLQHVANTAARCLWLHGDNRPAIAEVVANLEQALELICRHGHF
ncbi:putative serine/threonine-protein kinase-like protein CCR3 [Dichanthelium oligosanthes]|uniref:Putative serine/threonine-protein kinase-like protein CCR3 n=1 Tax=Dichanthelium oligosanthes TaxID=888268 RepID=A0A1E5V5B6_9POAL|nr:putative serine/threonine-protein kinase-like protein CCR3 [Dichanthelium oligosanthes]